MQAQNSHDPGIKCNAKRIHYYAKWIHFYMSGANQNKHPGSFAFRIMAIKELSYHDVASIAMDTQAGGVSNQQCHDLFGQYETAATNLPGLLVSDWKWSLTENIRVKSQGLTDEVFFSITEKGFIRSTVGGLADVEKQHLMNGGLLYWPEGCEHQLNRGTTVTGLTIKMPAGKLAELVMNEGRWGESIARKIENYEPFWVGGQQEQGPYIQEKIRQIRQAGNQGISRLLVESRVLDLLYYQLESIRQTMESPSPVKGISKDDIDKLYALKTYLDCHFLEELSLHQLVRISTLNEFKLKRGFKFLFGKTAFGFVQEKRMEYAADLLRNTDTTIPETAHIAGYQHTHHFSAAFKKHFGMTPKEWIR
ncbi:helix-turn-helix transcriptional regulator [Flavihumibacter stibioxidans]|uniref:HTH araC/xylS-type domain-containing protein n=1 Tax=Flavihumibacter stibioxidans TaxID=1834163 RepID=A0ABR7M5R0_9BACT|nr:AraC family transcriptional regulator [Flavihumibacter stibioxidans]MBC6490363.1 hypothetical protein [Flavihumibacter stibioxidans]